MKDLKPDLTDPQGEDNRRLANLLDPQSLNTFLKLLQDTNEKRTIDELFEALLEGKL